MQNRMGRSMKVAVIGAGVAGLSVARELQRHGHRVVVLEKREGLGGNWWYDSRTDSDPTGRDPNRGRVHSSLYLSLRTNLPRQLMGFSDYPFPTRQNGDQRTFPGHEEVLWFLNKFAEDFRLAELIRFRTEVVGAERRNDQWVVEMKTHGSDSVSLEVFEAVIICSGHFTEPRVAEIPGIEKWPGYEIHSHNYRVPEPFRNKVVIIIGKGASAVDISRDIATVAKEVHVATRHPDITVFKLEGQHNIWLHRMVKHVCEDSLVAFEDGSSIYADVILHCTGYKYHYPFLETNGTVTIDDNRVGPLYKHVFPPALAPSLAFIGISQKTKIILTESFAFQMWDGIDLNNALPWFTPFEIIELQSKWVALVLSGQVLLPTEEEMITCVQDYYKQMEINGLPKHYTHYLTPNEVEYRNWLLSEIGLPPMEEWRDRIYAECIKCINSMNSSFRDWDYSYWDDIIKSTSSIPLTYKEQN